MRKKGFEGYLSDGIFCLHDFFFLRVHVLLSSKGTDALFCWGLLLFPIVPFPDNF